MMKLLPPLSFDALLFGGALLCCGSFVASASTEVFAAPQAAPTTASSMAPAATGAAASGSAAPESGEPPTAASTPASATVSAAPGAAADAGPAAPAAAEGAPEPAAKAEGGRYDDLPENPALKRPLAEPPPPKPRKRERRVDLGVGMGVAARGTSSNEIAVSPGPVLSAHARVALVDWLGIVAGATVQRHEVTVANRAFGFEGLVAEQRPLTAVSLSAELDPRLALGRQWALSLGVGLAWNRLVAGEMSAKEPAEFGLDPRTGVLLDLSLSPRLSYRWTERFGLSLRGRGALALVQSGDIFASGQSELQTVRTDNGQLLSVGGFPELTHGLFAQISADVFF